MLLYLCMVFGRTARHNHYLIVLSIHIWSCLHGLVLHTSYSTLEIYPWVTVFTPVSCVGMCRRLCSTEGVWNAASSSNSLMRPQWACMSINHIITKGHHRNMADSCWPTPIYYVLLACEMTKCKINHDILHRKDWYCISERPTVMTMKYHSQPPLQKENVFEICHISSKDPLSAPKLSQPDTFGMLNNNNNNNKTKITSVTWHIDVILQEPLTGKTTTFT